MTSFVCDYNCKTVGECIEKHQIPDDWMAEFDVIDGVYPLILIQVEQIRTSDAMMSLRLKVVEQEDVEYAGCMLLMEQKIISFKIDSMSPLTEAAKDINTEII